ncbi:DUF499 domain-containing protein [Silanimonas sp.]|uniref:ATP-binding protein n=1 Tax=Silanimonas sp. TaxID=1929290 RepID=UPI0022C053D1|nr:DUF499 domain-containing protein [Silanimonas sp.]MCZ8164568.1 DUF499 domain-containing protein [Silanimonas sp.]
MTVPTIFDACQPRDDVREGRVSDADLAADLAAVIRGKAVPDYSDPARFFANTYPTRGLKNLLEAVCRRLSGAGGEAAAVLRLDTSFGGGKTHGLIALVHAAGGMKGVARPEEFIDPALLPAGPVRIAAFDGENADPANGRSMGDGVRAHTPWGEIAYALAGKDGFERVRASDEQAVAPGADTLKELFGNQPTLILLDEPAIYLRKVRGLPHGGRDQLAAFLTSLIKAVESSPNVSLVFSLAVGKDGRASDAYAEENDFLASRMAEIESVAARKATLLNPTEDDETALVLRRRLFAQVDPHKAAEVVAAYRALWRQHASALPPTAADGDIAEQFERSYPLHPALLDTLTHKTATLGTFHRVRGMLRLLVRTVAQLWQDRPADATAIHLHHIDPANPAIYQEIVTRLQQPELVPAIRSDVAGEKGQFALAQQIDKAQYAGLPPYTAYAARTVLVHTLAFNSDLRGVNADELRLAMLGPTLDGAFIDDARTRFRDQSAYLDDRPNAPLRFLYEPNLTQLVRREERNVDREEIRAALQDEIRRIFGGTTLDLVPFPAGPWDVPDEVGGGAPRLALINHEADTVVPGQEGLPDRVQEIFERKGNSGSLRMQRNNLVFLVADEGRVPLMVERMMRRLALQQMTRNERIRELPEHHQAKLREWQERSRHELAVAVAQCYRNLYYPARNRAAGANVDLAHSVIDLGTASDRPGAGQQQVLTALRDLNKLRGVEDAPESPAYVRDRTPLKRGQISTVDLRNEFRKDPALSILLGDDAFIKLVRTGVERGDYIYRRGDLVYGQGDPAAQIMIDEQSFVLTRAFAEQNGLWPRKPVGSELSPGQTAPTPAGASPSGGSAQQPYSSHTPTSQPPAVAEPRRLQAEGPLKEALGILFDRARGSGCKQLAALTVQCFDAGDLFRLLPAANGVSGASKQVTVKVDLEMAEGGLLTIDFTGPLTEAQLVREFLQPQLTAAKDKNPRMLGVELRFNDGLDLSGDAPERLRDQLTRVGNGAAFVSAEAERA